MLKTLDKATDGFKDGRKEAEKFAATLKTVNNHAQAAGKGAEKASSGFGKFAQSIARIAKYRLIRTALREIISGFKEGLTNAYNFSKGIGGTLAQAMDALSVKSQTMKNQLGSAFGELLTSVTPILLKIINIATRAANALSQLFAALGGRSTYLKAVDSTGDMAENLASGAGSAKELRRTLMGFDEINRLDSPDSGGGGGGGIDTDAYNNMFEETMLDEWTNRWVAFYEKLTVYLTKIKEAVRQAWDYIKNQIDWGVIFDGICTAIEGAVEFVAGILSADWDMAFLGAAHVVEGLGAIVDQVLHFVSGIVDGLITWVSDHIASFFDWISDNTGIQLLGLKYLITSILGTIKTYVGNIIEDLRMIFGGIIDFLAGVFTNNWERVWLGVAKILMGIGQSLVDTFYSAINFIISLINGLSGAIGDIISWFGGNGSAVGTIPTLTPPKVYQYADGGFPEDGLFFANHSELVGQFNGGKTVVANNQEIIAGIKQGVMEAMSIVMSNQNERPIENRVYLDGKEIGAASRRYERNINRATGVALA